MNTEPKKGIETTDTAHKAYTKRTIAIGIASVALVAALGIGAAYAHGGLNRKPNPPAGESTAAQAKEETQEKVELTAQEVADATGDLHFAGDDVSASSNTTANSPSKDSGNKASGQCRDTTCSYTTASGRTKDRRNYTFREGL